MFSANPISREENLRLIREENDWKNSLVMWVFPQEFAASVPRPVQAWFRTLVFCSLVYFGVGLAWVYYIYTCFGDKLFKPGTMPAKRDVFEQIWVSGARRRVPRARRPMQGTGPPPAAGAAGAPGRAPASQPPAAGRRSVGPLAAACQCSRRRRQLRPARPAARYALASPAT